jgi:hypothetical protein
VEVMMMLTRSSVFPFLSLANLSLGVRGEETRVTVAANHPAVVAVNALVAENIKLKADLEDTEQKLAQFKKITKEREERRAQETVSYRTHGNSSRRQ